MRFVIVVATLFCTLLGSPDTSAQATDAADVAPARVEGPMLHAPMLLRNDGFALRTNPATLAWLDGGHVAVGWSQSYAASEDVPRVF